MATTTTATPSRITTTTRSFPLASYFVLAYALSWLILVPAGLGLLPDSAGGVLPWVIPFGPAVAAFVVTADNVRVIHDYKVRRVVAFLPIAFGLGGSGRVPNFVPLINEMVSDGINSVEGRVAKRQASW